MQTVDNIRQANRLNLNKKCPRCKADLVESVDLIGTSKSDNGGEYIEAWICSQCQSVLSWGGRRANNCWKFIKIGE